MPKDSDITPQNFKLLLEWLDPDEDAAAGKDEKIRKRLIDILQFRGWFEAESLANATLVRVIAVVLALVGGGGVIAYLLAWLIMPKP